MNDRDAPRTNETSPMSYPTLDPVALRRHLTGPPAQRAFQVHSVELAYLHGSYTQQTAHPWSDVDIGILFPPGISSDEAIARRRALFLDIERLLHTDAIHLSILNDAPSLFRYQVIRYGALLYAEDDRKRTDFEATTYSRYFYDQPFYNLRRQYLARKMRPDHDEH